MSRLSRGRGGREGAPGGWLGPSLGRVRLVVGVGGHEGGVLGGSVGFAVIIALSMFGIGALLKASVAWLTALKWLGGAYLVHGSPAQRRVVERVARAAAGTASRCSPRAGARSGGTDR